MLFLLDPKDPRAPFPSVALAHTEPNGLLAVGGDLHPARLINAYAHGIFPWFNPGDPILWWSPDPRTLLLPETLRISRSLRKTLRRRPRCCCWTLMSCPRTPKRCWPIIFANTCKSGS